MDTTTLRVNGVCNADCSFCALSGRRALSQEEYGGALQTLGADRDRGASELRVSGGEPLIQPRLDGLIERAAGEDPEHDHSSTKGLELSYWGLMLHKLGDGLALAVKR